MFHYALKNFFIFKSYTALCTVKHKFNIQKSTIMYNSGFNGFFNNSVQSLRPLPFSPGTNQRITRHYFFDGESMNAQCPMRKVLCGELRLQDAGSSVEISGRIQNQRLGRFLSLKDDTGITQLVVPDNRVDIQRRLRNTPLNSFMVLRGLVTARPDKSRNEKMITGDIEVLIENLMSVHPKRKKGESESDDEDSRRGKKRISFKSPSLKLTSEELSKCPTPGLIRYFSQRSHTCNELSKRLVGKSITLCGWVSAKRVGRFVMLKDGYGSVQIVPEIQNIALTNKFQNLHVDCILVVKGIVSRRPPGHENPRMENGSIEILVESLTVVNPHDPVPRGEEDGVNDGDGKNSGKKTEYFAEKELEKETELIVPNPNKFTMRTHTCGELNDSQVGQKVRLMGWVEFSRLKKFVLLRDCYGKTQLIIPESRVDLQNIIKDLTLESVLLAEGTVCSRPPGQENAKQKTGKIEVSVTDLHVLNAAKILPFYFKEFQKPHEPIRMKYRYLDLRYEIMQNNLRLRSKTVHKIRRFLIEHLDFVEVETPTLFKRTPGGAQEFVVPTQKKGKFYALVQSPQQFKQLLMIGSVDRYFQIARCYRDESGGNDRQPEFTQLDIEMSFCNREDIINLIEDLLKNCWPENMPPMSTPFPRLSYEEAMTLYGTDKPDLRFDWKFENLTSLFQKMKGNCKGQYKLEKFFEDDDFAAYAFVGRKGGVKFSNDVKKGMIDQIKNDYSNIGFLPIAVKSLELMHEKLEALFCSTMATEIQKATKCGGEDVLFLAFGPKGKVLKALGQIRLNFANYLEEKKIELRKKNSFNFVWILDFPLFELNGNKIESNHHPFTAPHPDDEHLIENDPLKVKGLHFDLVLNGNEIGGGSIRIKSYEMQKMVLENILKINSESISHLLEGLASGAPPHGGIAIGLDRLMALICGAQSIREVIAFPKGSLGNDPMSGAPCDITDDEKIRYHLKLSS